MMFQKKYFKKRFLAPLVLGLVWAVLAKGSFISFSMGIPAVVLGLWACAPLPELKPFKISLKGVFPFLAYFFKHTLLAGIDVALRIFRPSCPLSPGLIRYTFNLKNEVSKIFFCHVVSLMPGTLSADLKEGEVLIHLLDKTMPNKKNLNELERKIALLFAEGAGS